MIVKAETNAETELFNACFGVGERKSDRIGGLCAAAQGRAPT